MIAINGGWDKGFVLGWHTEDYYYIGKNLDFIHTLSNTRSVVGSYISKVKRCGDVSSVNSIVKLFDIVQGLNEFDYIISVPPSKNSQNHDASKLISLALAKKFGIQYLDNFFIRSESQQIKTVFGKENRINLINSCIMVNPCITVYSNSSLLLIDDVYETGATLETLAFNIKDKVKNCFLCVVAISATKNNDL
jgi:predicted amidophosphoribosyltransferase